MVHLIDTYISEISKIFDFDFVDAIILFGSYNSKTNSKMSDIDICVITNKGLSLEEKFEILQFKDEILDISLFEELPLSLQDRVMREGAILKSKISLESLKIQTINQYRDFKPILNRIYQSKGLLHIE